MPVLLDNEASEPALRNRLVPGLAPRLLHLATHGVVPDPLLSPTLEAQRSRPAQLADSLKAAAPAAPPALLIEEPMLHSALALAGAARAKEAAESKADGVLTADEARELSLDGSQLVVLSACQTAVGSVRAGDGIYGLRRAFLAAGAEAVVASLWQIADRETGSLMTRYYELLVQGRRPRITAMREAMQATMKDHPHPYYWAPFIAIGRDAPILPVEPATVAQN